METEVSFQDITFKTHEKGVRARFMNNYHFDFSDEELSKIGKYSVKDGSLFFAEREKRVWNKFNLLLSSGFERLRHKIRDKACLYVHRESGIPLLGTNEFGLVDRGSNIIEIKPLTGCNLSCSFCSVNEGINNKTDIVVEEEYLIQEFKILAVLKEHPVEANIGPQGEPLLYPRIVDLVRDLKDNGAAVVSINTNGTLLSPKMIEDLAEAGLDRINLSLHALDQALVTEMMQGSQQVQHMMEVIRLCEGKIDILLAPVLVPGMNDDQLDGLIELSKKIKNKRFPSIGIQNFLTYSGGRNPGVTERSWEEFYAILKEKEKKHDVSLTLREGDNPFDIHSEKTLEKPFQKGDFIAAKVLAKGRNKNEVIAVAGNRCITVKNCDADVNMKVKVKILRDKHNIFTGILS